MSIRALSWAWGQDLPPVPKLVLLALADHANEETGECWPSVARLVRMTGLGERTVRRALKSLADRRLLEVEGRTDERKRPTSNLYRLPLVMVPQRHLTLSEGQGVGATTTGGMVPERQGVGATVTAKPQSRTLNKEPSDEPLTHAKKSQHSQFSRNGAAAKESPFAKYG